MTREDIIRMAQEAGIVVIGEAAFKLCQLVAQHEREACIKAIEDQIGWDMDDPESTAIKAIRARGQA